jgi:predicted DNA binding CopG/RHH family protein
MREKRKETRINVRVTEPVFMRLRRMADEEDLKISDLVRKALRKTYGSPKQNS